MVLFEIRLILSKILLLISISFPNLLFAQIVFYQDSFKGGVTGDAFNPAYWNVSGDFDIYIEPGSTIRKAYLFASVYNSPDERIAYFNGSPIILNTNMAMDNDYYFVIGSYIDTIRTIAIDVTNLMNPLQNSYSITPPANQPIPSLGGCYTEFYLIVFYENPLLDVTSSIFAVNNLLPQQNIFYSFDQINPVNNLKNMGLIINASQFCDTIQDGSFVKIDGELVGLIGGHEDNSPVACNGVAGSFFYQEGLLFGLGNDQANTTMSGNDAIATIESYLISNDSFGLHFEYQSNYAPQTNPIGQIFLTYSSTCDSFSVTVPNDTTICSGESLQLNVTGGTSTGSAPAYEWSSLSGSAALSELSCINCPNPVFSGDTSRYYTVRIWNNDSCSVVRPIKISVRPKPTFASLIVQPSECGTTSGSVQLNVSAGTNMPILYTLNGTSQSANTFNNLASGSYTLSFSDGNGCKSKDTLVNIPEVISVVADFTVSPDHGVSPLIVSISNESINATDYLWFVNETNFGNSLPTYTFNTPGNYTIELAAWQNDPSCSDTFAITVHVIDSLLIPTLITPNNDGKNDEWILQNIDQLYPNNEVVIFNRWGNVVFESEKGNYESSPWNGTYRGKDLPMGTYFYIIRTGANDHTGHVSLVR